MYPVLAHILRQKYYKKFIKISYLIHRFFNEKNVFRLRICESIKHHIFFSHSLFQITIWCIFLF